MASWMTDLLGAGAKILVELAFGANPGGDPSGWTWTDVTGDVFETPGLDPTFGRADEASQAQPGKTTFRLDNRTGAYSRGGESPNYPNVRLGVPMRVRIDPDGSGYMVAWWGTVVSWKPKWPYHAAPYVDVEAAGTLRRLTQGALPVQSVFRRALSADIHTAAYWPMEDGKNAAYFAPAVSTGSMAWPPGQHPSLAASSTIDGSLPLPTLNKAEIIAWVPPYNFGSQFIAVRMLAVFPTTGEPSGTLLAVWFNNGSLGNCFFTYNSVTQAIDLAAYDNTGALITVQSGLAGSAVGARRCSFEFIQFGPSVIIAWIPVDLPGTYPSYSTYTFAGGTVGTPWLVVLGDPANGLNQIAVGHVAVQDGYSLVTGYTAQQKFLNGRDHWNTYAGEYADARISRLGAENNVSIQVMGGSDTQMGPQSVDTLINLWRECEAADGGAIHDGNGMTDGLMYMTRQFMESRAADLTLSAQADLIGTFEPVDDDRLIRNSATVTRTKGTTVTYSDVNTSVNGVAYVGSYATSGTVNLYSDAQLTPYAQWVVALGTYDGYRFSDVSIDLRRATKTYARTVLGLMPGMRIDVTNLSAALTAFTGGTVSLVVQSVSHQLNARVWQTRFTCSPFGPWQVGVPSPNTDGSSIFYMGAAVPTVSVSQNDLSGITVTNPTQAGVGDLLLMWATVRNSGTGTINLPSDWTALVTSGNCVLAGRFVRPGEPNPILSVNSAVSNEIAVSQAVAIRGVYPDINNCVHASQAQLNTSAANVAYPGLTITQPNCWVGVFAWKQNAWTSVAQLAGMTEAFDSGEASGNGASIAADYVIQTTAANLASGSFTVTGGANAISRAVSIALLPATTPAIPERVDTPGSTLSGAVPAGATSMSVASTSTTTITYVGIGAASAGNNASLTPALPASIQTNDLLLCWATIRNTGATVTVPAGWTSLVSLANCTLMGKYAQPAETAPTVTYSGGAAGDTTTAQIAAWRGTGQVLSTVVHNSATQTNASAQNVAYPGLTITQDGCLIIVVTWKQNVWTSKAPIALEISDSPEATGTGASFGWDYLIGGTASNITSGTDTITGGAAAVSKAFTVAIKPHTSGVLWTTDSNDYPLNLSVGGIQVTATACSGTATPQTMAINAASHALTNGAAVALWQPPGLGR